MSNLVPFLIIGLVNGAIYALAALGLTLTYKTTGVFNFAYGAIAAASAYFFYDLNDVHHVSWPVAMIATLVVFGVFVGLVFERFGDVLSRATMPMQIVGTVGVMVAVQGVIVIKFGSQAESFSDFLPSNVWTHGSIDVSVTQAVTVGLAVVFAIGLWLLLRFTTFGTTTRAVIDSPDLLALTGRSPSRVRRWSWILGSGFAALSGVLSALTVTTLDPTILTLLLVQAFGAAAIGAFKNLGLTFLGGIVVGLLAALTTDWVGSIRALGGLPTSIPFLVLLVVLLVLPRRKLTGLQQRVVEFKAAPRRLNIPAPARIALAVAAAALVLLAPQILGFSRLSSLTQALALAALFLSLGVLVKLSGQISLCQYGLAAVGASTFSHLVVGAHVPWLLAVPLAGLVAVPVGAVIAIPAIRLSGLFLALATFGFGLLLQQLAYQSFLMFGSSFDVVTPRPSWASSQLSYYYLVAGCLAVCGAIVVFVTRSRLGRLLRGLGGSPVAMASNGASTNVMKVLIFSISAFLAGVGGALIGPVTGSTNATPFDPLNSLTLLAVLFLAGAGMFRYAVIGGVALALIPSYITDPKVANYLPVVFGVSAILIATLAVRRRSGLPGWQALTARIDRRRPPDGDDRPSIGVVAPMPEPYDERPKVTAVAAAKDQT